MQVENRALESLTPYAKNSRTHSDRQIAQIAASIKEFGWTNPILVDGDNGIIAGHGRVLAARKLGMKEVPVIELTGMSKSQKQAYVIADNKLALNAGWDHEILSLELEELGAVNFNLDLLGFSALKEDLSAPQVGAMEYKVIVDCASESHQLEILDRLEAEGLICRALIS